MSITKITKWGYPVKSYSIRHERKQFIFWWDISESCKLRIGVAGEIHFIRKDTGQKVVVPAQKLLPLLTQKRRTNRATGTWGIKVLADDPGELAIEELGVNYKSWIRTPLKWE